MDIGVLNYGSFTYRFINKKKSMTVPDSLSNAVKRVFELYQAALKDPNFFLNHLDPNLSENKQHLYINRLITHLNTAVCKLAKSIHDHNVNLTLKIQEVRQKPLGWIRTLFDRLKSHTYQKLLKQLRSLNSTPLKDQYIPEYTYTEKEEIKQLLQSHGYRNDDDIVTYIARVGLKNNKDLIENLRTLVTAFIQENQAKTEAALLQSVQAIQSAPATPRPQRNPDADFFRPGALEELKQDARKFCAPAINWFKRVCGR